MTSGLNRLVNDNKTRKNRPRIKNIQLLKIRIQPTVSRHRVVRPIPLRRWRVFSHALHFSGDHPTNQHRPPPTPVNPKTIVCPSTTRRRTDAATLSSSTPASAADPGPRVLEPVAYDGAYAASGDGGAEGGGVPRSEGAGEGGAVEAEELVAVGGAPGGGVRCGSGGGSDLDGVAAVFETLDGPTGVVDF